MKVKTLSCYAETRTRKIGLIWYSVEMGGNKGKKITLKQSQRQPHAYCRGNHQFQEEGGRVKSCSLQSRKTWNGLQWQYCMKYLISSPVTWFSVFSKRAVGFTELSLALSVWSASCSGEAREGEGCEEGACFQKLKNTGERTIIRQWKPSVYFPLQLLSSYWCLNPSSMESI